jgi:hypothetical protein
VPSETVRKFEPMFDSRKTFTGQLTDAVDLMIDFATLGEYGLEPVASTPAPACEGRRRSGNLRSTGTWNSAINRFATQP